MKGFIKRLLKVLLFIIGGILTIIYLFVWFCGLAVIFVIALPVYLFFDKGIIWWYMEKIDLTIALMCDIEEKIDSL
jgi:hypothetical protein